MSAAITANLFKGETLGTACKKAKTYINEYLISADTLVGKHNYAFN